MAYGVAKLQHELDTAETMAWSALAESNFLIFGYWCDMWAHINRMGEFKKTNPFVPLVNLAKAVYDEKLRNNSVLQALAQRGEPK